MRGDESNSANAWPMIVTLIAPVVSGIRDGGGGTVLLMIGLGYENMTLSRIPVSVELVETLRF